VPATGALPALQKAMMDISHSQELNGSLFFNGLKLQNAVFETPEERKFIVRSLIPENSITMFYAPDGIGKSTLSLQMCLEMASGIPVFGGFQTRKPMNVIYIMAERHRLEAFERIKRMSQGIAIGWEGFTITDKLQGFNILEIKDFNKFVREVCMIANGFKDIGGANYIHIDPIYALVPKGLTTEEGSGTVRMVCERLASETGASVGFNHHANRGTKNPDNNNKREGQDMYGSRFLSAPCTGIFKIEKGKNGTSFLNEKDSLMCLIDKFDLTYNLETDLSYLDPSKSTMSKTSRVRQFFNNHFLLKKEFEIDTLMKECDLSSSFARGEVSGEVKAGRLINTKTNGVKALYRVLSTL
jgi:RecA-family ATPase